ncbi:hypothetical protein ICN18_04350 [Polynucleobacter sp. Ross1-W9]|uniref:hypothetical protein n=1 Tax=Polynucleobacter parvulilacunae TaxID=1855631 RepID=UPI001C0BB9DF|nr:hypothetical protein [Polynucleobacter parvulilacunae]MBU3556854.1 hypothetical protein [Polynucleobacter parvulilacunae]
MKTRFSLFSALAASIVLLSACGGGGSGSTAVTPTPATTAPVAATFSNQLASSVSVSGYSALSIASKTSSSVQTAGIKGMFQNLLARLISPAYAATCATDAYKLVGVNADGTSTPISVTASGADQCGVGFRSMFDAGKYILLTGDSIYKDDLTCNLVFLNKSTGELFCVGETVPAKYDILGQSAWKNYPRIQLSDDKNYLFLEAASVIFDSNNQITGKKTKLMRFDLSDDNKGPQATVLVEGFQNSWLSASGSGFSGDASQFEGFEIQNYAGLNNGDSMVMYNRYVYNTGGSSMSMTPLSKLNNFYYRFEADSSYKRLEVDVDKAGTLVQQEINGNAGNNATFAPGNIYQIPCYFRSTANKDKFYFAIPYYYWDGTRSYNKSLIVSAVRPSASASKLDVNRYTSTAMCGNSWNQTASYQIINGIYYSLDTNWVYNVNNGSGSQVTALTKKDMGFATETPVADVVYTISSDTSWGGSKQIFVSKDYLYIKAPNAGGWTGTSTPGDSLDRYDPAQFDKTRSVGQQLGTALSILRNSDNISVQSIASTSGDNILKVVGRRTDDADLVKVYGTVDEAGLLSWAAQKSTTYSPVTIVKL